MQLCGVPAAIISSDPSFKTLTLFRYYVLEFDHSTNAVTVTQSQPLLRAAREGWGSNKLAVEGEVFLFARFFK